MPIFDDIQNQALDMLVDFDLENGALYRYSPGTNGENDGFNKEFAHNAVYLKQIKLSIARGTTTNGSEYIGTTRETDIAVGDIIEIVNPRGKKRRWTVQGFEPTEQHTLLELDEVRNNGT
jgi:hypothetical protein